MASFVFSAYKQALLGGDRAWDTDDMRVILIDLTDDTPTDSDDYLDDIAAPARVATSSALQNPSITGGVADADDITFSSVSGDGCDGALIYYHTGTEGTSLLCAWVEFSAPVTPDGTSITIQWDSGANKIFSI